MLALKKDRQTKRKMTDSRARIMTLVCGGHRTGDRISAEALAVILESSITIAVAFAFSHTLLHRRVLGVIACWRERQGAWAGWVSVASGVQEGCERHAARRLRKNGIALDDES